tara:strand:+ start:5309 stop:5743 length:435 start_codon:yes stop_codon:yes gene_type:complete
MYLGSTFSKLTNEECARLIDAGDVRTYHSGDVIIGEGDTLQALMLIKTGNVRVTRTYLDDLSAEFTGPLGPGEVVGEMSFIDGKGASANLIADGITEMLVLPRDQIEKILADEPTLAGRFYESLFLVLARKLRATNMRVLPVSP